jgi:hypothetical protein
MRETNPLSEIRSVRDVLSRRFGGDAWALSRALAEQSRAAGRAVVRFPPRPPQPPRAVLPQAEPNTSAPPEIVVSP